MTLRLPSREGWGGGGGLKGPDQANSKHLLALAEGMLSRDISFN